MKLICNCGNIQELVSDNKMEQFEIRNCEDGTIALICRKCNEIIYIPCKQ